MLLGLLAVVALVAMVGVGNTLSLSVIERTRESALLRALGLGRRSLRLMLLVEAVALSVLALVVGALAGVWFGWSGATVVLHEVGAPASALVVPWARVGVAALAVVVAAALASVGPGRAAARATPIEALADLG
jgi:putative ABC transport system permease protein